MKRLAFIGVCLLVAGAALSAQTQPFTLSGPAWVEVTDSKLIQTDDATPTTMYSVPVDTQKVIVVEALMVAVALDFSSGAVQGDTALFARLTGNVVRTFQNLGAALNNWTAPAPSYSLNANTATQSIDVVVTGKATTPVRWYLSIHYRVTS